jgi:hypothetical protein
MDIEELNRKLAEVKKGVTLFDTIIDQDWESGEARVTKKQAEYVRKIMRLFNDLNWKVALNLTKNSKFGNTKPIKGRCGVPVKIRPASEKDNPEQKTFFGILLGAIALSIGLEIDGDTVIANHSFYNPGIYVPELNKIVYGCESWWGEIENYNDVDKLITNDTINSVWYVKMLASIIQQDEKPKQKESASPKKNEIIRDATKKLKEFMATIIQLEDNDWDALSNDMGENEQICWAQIELLIEYFEDLG